MEVLAAVSVPQVLKFAYDALRFTWEQYQNIQGNQAQCHLLIQRCQDLFIEVSTQISRPWPQGMEMHHDRMANQLQSLNCACVAVKTTIRRLADKGFAWRLLHQDKIKEELAAAETAIGDAMSIFNLGTHLSAQQLQIEIASAQKADQNDLVARLDSLANNDRKILAALQADTRGRRRLEESILALDKHVKGITTVRNDPAGAFLLTAPSALQRMSGQPTPEIPHWAVTGLEVTFDPDDDESCIGKGGFGNIYKGEWNGQVVAVKEMYSEDARLLDRDDLKHIRHEIMIWSRIAHPHLLPFYCACLEATRPFIVTRFCANGNVLEYLRQNPDADRVVLLHEVSLGMIYLHSQGIIHADLKGSNVLVGDDHKAVIADFGLSHLQDQIASATTRTKKASGTLRRMAPELLDAEPLDKPADVYSFALLAWELYTGLVPFGDLPEWALTRRVVDKRERPPRPVSMEDDIWGLVQQWWVHEASLRPVFGSIQTQLKGILLKGRTTSASAVASIATSLDATYSVPPNTNSLQPTSSSDALPSLFESFNISAETAWTKASTSSNESRTYFDPWDSPTAVNKVKTNRSPDEPHSDSSNWNAWYPVATPKDPLPALPTKKHPDAPTENAWQVYGQAAAGLEQPHSTLRNRELEPYAAYPIATTKTSPKKSPQLHVHDPNPEGATGAHDLLCVAINDQWVAVGLASSEIRVYNAVTGAFHTVLKGHKSSVWDVELASWDDIKYRDTVGGANSILLSGGADHNIRVWDVETGSYLHSLLGHTATIRSIKALAGRSRAVSGGRDRAAFVWDVKRGVCLHKLTGHMDSIRCIAISGQIAVTASYDSTCRVWDTDYGIERHVLCGHTGRVYCVTIDGARIVSGGEDKTVRVWDAKSGDCEVIISEHSGLVQQLQLSPTHVVSAGADGMLVVYTFKTSTVHVIKAHDSLIVSLQLDSPHVISGSTDGTVKMWDLFSGKYIRHIGRPGEPSKSPWRFAGGRARSSTWVISSEIKGHGVIHIWTK
ncbi:WD40 repeat-like protein [Pleurotus eryngii]|uniref:WD40 repeat-like protein n=1 Tax=Pleurotus eryngii TaxID=5323 RepID=A0A9P6A617_PLEER|nr:WD40 repeat-like protein [Pleurotus eryngii]